RGCVSTAQQYSASTRAATRSAPHPACDGPQATASGLVAVLQQPAPEDPEGENPHGEPLPPAERGAIGDLVARWAGCLASGNLRGLLGLFTTDGARRLLAERTPYVG